MENSRESLITRRGAIKQALLLTGGIASGVQGLLGAPASKKLTAQELTAISEQIETDTADSFTVAAKYLPTNMTKLAVHIGLVHSPSSNVKFTNLSRDTIRHIIAIQKDMEWILRTSRDLNNCPLFLEGFSVPYSQERSDLDLDDAKKMSGKMGIAMDDWLYFLAGVGPFLYQRKRNFLPGESEKENREAGEALKRVPQNRKEVQKEVYRDREEHLAKLMQQGGQLTATVFGNKHDMLPIIRSLDPTMGYLKLSPKRLQQILAMGNKI